MRSLARYRPHIGEAPLDFNSSDILGLGFTWRAIRGGLPRPCPRWSAILIGSCLWCVPNAPRLSRKRQAYARDFADWERVCGGLSKVMPQRIYQSR